MKIRNILSCILLSVCTLGVQAQKETQARQLLDKTAAIFNDKGVDVKFRFWTNGNKQDQTSGSIAVKGNKFHLTTPSAITWFDGKTQWSYLPANQEVNVSNPTPEELQSINPYAFIGLYKQGYTYRVGARKNYQGKAIDEIDLQAENPKQEIQAVKLYVDKRNAQPLYIKITDCNKNINEIEVTSLKKTLLLPDNRFIFDTKQYPNAEVIDLR